MRTYIIGEVGSDNGPCAETGCGHAYCFSERRIASFVCPKCDEAIGIGVEFVMNGHVPAHARCSLPTCSHCKKQILPCDELSRSGASHKSCAAKSISLLR